MPRSYLPWKLASLSCASLASWLLIATASGQVLSETPVIQVRLQAAGQLEGQLVDLAAGPDSLYMVDAGGHRVLVVRDGHVIRSIGSIGNGPGDFYYPSEIAIRADGTLCVSDAGNGRLQFLGPDGEFKSQIAVRKSWGLALSEDLAFTGQPETGSLITSYDRESGATRGFGTLVNPDKELGTAPRGWDEAFKLAINRIRLAVESNGDIWVAFVHLPYLRKYSPRGELLIEVSIADAALQEIKRSLSNPDLEPSWTSSLNTDGVTLPVAIHDIAFDPRLSVLLALFGDNRIGIFDQDGNLTYLLRFANLEVSLSSLARFPGTSEVSLSSLSGLLLQTVGLSHHEEQVRTINH